MIRPVAAPLLPSGGAVGCASSGESGYVDDCDAQCQRELVAADGERLPGGQVFDADTSRCSLWNEEPEVIRFRFTSLYPQRYGAGANPGFHFEQQLQKAITVSCQSYTGYRVRRVVQIVHNVTGNTWASG